MNIFRKILAVICHYCPLCGYARSKPDSWIGKILNYPWHANYCPMWNAEKDVYGEPGRESSKV